MKGLPGLNRGLIFFINLSRGGLRFLFFPTPRVSSPEGTQTDSAMKSTYDLRKGCPFFSFLNGALLLALVLTGCTSPRVGDLASYPSPLEGRLMPEEEGPSVQMAEASSPPVVYEGPVAEVAARLEAAALDWEGVPYRLGGTSRRGIDCSFYVRTLYSDLFAEDLPRTTREQVLRGTPVRKDALLPGDLVFFRTGRSTRHVGIYLGNGAFTHASSSQGVMTSRLDDAYWVRTYWTARRLLPVETPLPEASRFSRAEAPPEDAAEPTTRPRIGWEY